MATTYQGFSQTDFARSMATTLEEDIRELEEAALKNFQLGAQLEAAGRVTYNHGGRGYTWPVKYKNHTLEGNTGETERNFVRTNLYKTARLGYRGYQCTDSMFYAEFLENNSPQGIINVYDSFLMRLRESMQQGLGSQYYIDGSTTANSEFWEGFETMFATNGTVTVTTGAQRAANAADLFGYPNDTYANLTTGLGDYGGDNNSNAWPLGVSDPEYDFWSPLIVCYNSTALGGTAHTFAGQGDEALRLGIIHSQRNATKDGQLNNIVLDRTLYMNLLNLIDDKERIAITSETSLRAMGFKNVLNFDGIEVSWEVGVPANVGYGYNIQNIDLRSQDKTLLRSEGPEYYMKTQSFDAVVSTRSNLKFKSPRNQVKWMSIAS